jgi:glutamine amidotransferase
MLTREAASEHQVRASGLHIQGRDDRPAPAVLLASVPLTPEIWEPLPENTLLVLQQGRLIARMTS